MEHLIDYVYWYLKGVKRVEGIEHLGLELGTVIKVGIGVSKQRTISNFSWLGMEFSCRYYPANETVRVSVYESKTNTVFSVYKDAGGSIRLEVNIAK